MFKDVGEMDAVLTLTSCSMEVDFMDMVRIYRAGNPATNFVQGSQAAELGSITRSLRALNEVRGELA